MVQAIPRWLLIFLLLFNSVGAFYGSFLLLLDPSGTRIQLPLKLLEGSPFKSYFIPGVILLLVNGLLPLAAALGLLFRQPAGALPGFPFLKNQHWAWSLALAAGLGLTIWIGVQVALLGYWSEIPIQAIFGTLGLLLTGLTVLPPVRKFYRIAASE